ncbi:thermonuclease family protein [Patescibacteria group bacterium]|nr:thermonuclease family protein [Patescibacteria group bacterium]MBU1472664.1 thermonuclease family protein [Patescibacteria group bacterium]MBU2459902.1 thermonuclease family protein [Patescibacteria group bacterium]MBU2544708.1 thermonuclease family protein [Patescibacteria group bacterium]
MPKSIRRPPNRKPASQSVPLRFLPLLLLFFSVILNVCLLFKLRGNAVVTSVIDGDSFELSDGRRVRLMGVDAPEDDRCMADEAKNRLTQILTGRHVRLKHAITDDFGRTVAIVIIEDFNSWLKAADPLVNRLMVRDGLARDTGAPKDYQQTMREAAAYARENKLGIYSPLCRQKTSPTDCNIKGNLTDRRPVYYLPSCKAYADTIIDLSFGDEWFCTEQEALAAGFTLSPTCLPR